MMKWLKKFALEIAPPVTATVLGAFLVHQLWPSGDSNPQPAKTPPTAHAPAESVKPASASAGAEANTTAAVPTTVTAPPTTVTSVAPSASKPGRHPGEVAKSAPSNEPREEMGPSVLDRAEKALASIPPAKSAGPSLPTRVAPPPPPAVTTQEPPGAPVSPPPAVTPPVVTAAVPPPEPPPMDPPREIAAPATSVVPPPPSLLPQRNQQAQTKNNNPLRVSHSDRENLADIPVGDDVVPPDQAPAANSPDAAPPSPPAKQKNIIENIFAPLQSVLPERMR